MSTVTARASLAAVSVVVATAAGIVTNIATDEPNIAWWVTLGCLLLLGALTQVGLTLFEGRSSDVTAAGVGSVAVGGTTRGSVTTHVQATGQQSSTSMVGGINAQGPGSIAIGGEALGDVSTDVTESGGSQGT